MSYQDERLNHIQAEINRIDNIKRGLREREKSLNARDYLLRSQPSMPASNIKTLQQSFMGNLPSHMVPGNVGGINNVTWPFLFQVNIDFGADPTILETTHARGSFQVDQEASFLLMGISRAHNTDENGFSATVLAPIQVEIIDRQSSRRFNNAPMPLQMIGSNSLLSIMPTPMYVQPNAFIDIDASGIPAVGQDFTGSGEFQLSFYGYRIRTEDAGKVLSTIFGY